MAKTINELKDASVLIRDEEREGQNSAKRVGGLFCDIVDYMDENGGGSGTTLNHPVSDINTLNANPEGNDKILVWNNNQWEYQNKPSGGGGGGASSLSELDDVSLSYPINSGEVLKFDGSKWINSSAGRFTQVQSDWNESNTNAPSYINNKPNIVTSNIAGLEIRVVSSMPSNPDSNTIYIVQY